MIQKDQLSVELSGGTVEQQPATFEETRSYFKSLYNNLVTEVEKVNTVNRKMRKTNADLTTELAKYKGQEKSFEINKAKFDELETEAGESLDKITFLEKENECLLRAVVSQDIMSIVQRPTVVETFDLQTKLECMKERFENYIIKKETEYAKLWNDWYKKCEEYKYDKISYDKAYNKMQHQIERLQAQLGDLKGKSMDTQCASDTLDPLSQKLEDENVSLEFQVLNYAKENAHLKTTYKNLFDSINVTRAQTKIINDSLQDKLNDTIYENAKLRAQLFDKVSEQKDTTKGTSANTKFANPSTSGTKLYSVTPLPKTQFIPKVVETINLSKPITSNSVPTTKGSKVEKNDKVIAPGMFRIFKTSREEKCVPINKARASVRTNLTIVSQPHVITKKDVNFDSNGLSSTGVDNIDKTRRPQPRSNTKNGDNACTSNPKEPTSKRFPNSTFSLFLGTVRLENDHIAGILGYGDLQWGNILITRVYVIEGLGHNLFSVGQFCDSDLEVAFRRNTCFVKNLEGVDLLKGDHTTNLYTINLHEMAFASHICLLARATSTKSWLWHQRLSHLNFDTINDLAKNDLVHFLRSKDETPDVIKTFLKKFQVLLQALVITVRTDNGTKFKNQMLKEYFDDVGISHQTSSVKTPQQNGVVERRNQMLVEAARTMLIFSCAQLFLWADAIATACYTQNQYTRTKKIMKTMNVTLDELLAMAFEQRSSKPGLQGMTFGQTTMYDDYIDVQPSSAPRTTPAAPAPQVLQTPTASTTIAYNAPTPTNSSSQSPNIPITSQDVDELSQQQHVQ
ncbi:retrovirus-related pol polyprotein from transposon TNT 1-94 [Tanacetum coccineum]